MSSILVLELEPAYIERIHSALGAEGWQVRMVQEPSQAFQAAASEAPELVIVSAAVPGVEVLAAPSSRHVGGPGVVGLLAEGTAGTPGLSADELLAKPFSEQDLRVVVRRALSARRGPAPDPARPRQPEMKLTSHDIFGDVLA